MRKIATIFLALLCFSPTWAKQLTQEEAWKVARSFFNQSGNLRSAGEIHLVALSGDLIESSSLRSTSGQTAFYVFNQGNSAYAIVSGDDRMKPVLAYSNTGAFVVENIPSNIKALLTAYQDYYSQLDNQQKLPQPVNFKSSNTFSEDVQPLLGDINWNQDEPYYNLCPEVEGKRSVTGCVATAMAMVMKYFEYPQKGIGSHSYKTPAGNDCSFNFGATTFDWKNMLPQYTAGKYTDAQGKAVAELMYACGVAVEMDYSPDGSGAMSSIVADALINYFGYSKNMGYVSRNFFSTQEWMEMVKKELNEKRPILYCGASKEVGHEFVLDGYDKNNLVHVNWGWGGMNNGYFEIASLEPSSPGIGGGSSLGGGFIFQQGMVTGMHPESQSTPYTSYFTLGELKASKSSFSQNENFDLTAINFYNMTSTFYKGEVGIIVEGKDGVQHPIKSYTFDDKVNTDYGYETLNLENITIPAEIKDGTYNLYLGTKEERESQYSRVRSTIGCGTEYILTIKDSKCNLNVFTGLLNLETDLNVSIRSLHGLYEGMNGDFELTFSNSSSQSEFYGMAGVMLLTKEKDPQIVTILGKTQLLLPANTQEQKHLVSESLTQQTQTDSIIPISEGDYLAATCIQWGNYWYSIGEPLEIQIKKGKICENVIAQNAAVAQSKIGLDDPLQVTADLLLDGEGDVFNNIIVAAIFAEGESSTQNMHTSSVFIESSNLPYKLSMNFNPNVTAGKYAVVLFQYVKGDFVQLTPGIPFEVSATPTGIEDLSSTNGVTVYGISSNNVLRIRTSALAKNATIYSITGHKIHQKELTPGIGNDYSFQVNHLNKGFYILVVQTTDGKTYSTKFRKK